LRKENFLRRNDSATTVGGPVKKDKLFFFWSQEWNRERRGQVRQAWIPTAAEQGGDFSDLAAARIAAGADPTIDPRLGLTNQKRRKRKLYTGRVRVGHSCPRIRQPRRPNQIFPGIHYSDGTAQPCWQAYLSQLPSPNISNLCASHDWVSQVGIPLTWREENARGDYNLTKSTTLMIKLHQ